MIDMPRNWLTGVPSYSEEAASHCVNVFVCSTQFKSFHLCLNPGTVLSGSFQPEHNKKILQLTLIKAHSFEFLSSFTTKNTWIFGKDITQFHLFVISHTLFASARGYFPLLL